MKTSLRLLSVFGLTALFGLTLLLIHLVARTLVVETLLQIGLVVVIGLLVFAWITGMRPAWGLTLPFLSRTIGEE
jgi:cell division protein FtsW (lipid II flippase)